MGKIAFVFPGQGAQYSGMGKQLYENSDAARTVFDMADSIRPGTSKQCFEGPAEDLAVTENTQPCLYCVELAAAAALTAAGIKPAMVAGFSLGELAALAFSGAMSYEDAFRLVCRRAEHMHRAAQGSDAAMAAVLKLDDETVTQLCGEFPNVYPVNFNSPGQVVVAGESGSMDAFKALVTQAGGKAMMLKVSGGFHSPFMASAFAAFLTELEQFDLKKPIIPVYANVTAQPYAGDMKRLLAEQIVNPVRWQTAVENMMKDGADTFVEVGPGKVLSGLIKRISGTVRVLNVENAESLESTAAEVREDA